MSRLAGKVALVTGASKGIGAAIAKQLAAEGARVVVNYASSKEGADKVVAEIKKNGGDAVAIGGSVAKEEEIEKLIAGTKQAYGRLDILVNNAGVYAFGAVQDITAEEYKRQFDINVLGLILTTKHAATLMNEGGSVVNISSVVSKMAPAMTTVYSATKGAVDTITKTLAKELGPRKIRVNAINPGFVKTEGNVSFQGGEFEQQALAGTPLGRVGEPDDIALPTAFLASDEARWITGETIFVSGGAAI